MITSARPMAIRRSRVHTRISLRKGCGGAGLSAALASERSLLTLTAIGLTVTREDDAGAGVSGDVEVAGCFSSSLSILRRLVFIAWAFILAPDSILSLVLRVGQGHHVTVHYSDS